MVSDSISNYCLSYELIVEINRKVVARSGHTHAILNAGKIKSALGQPNQTFDGQALYPTVIERAAVLMHGLAQAHGFFDGNKRTSWIAGVTYLASRGYNLRLMAPEEAGGTLLALVNGKMSLHDFTAWIHRNIE